MLATEERTGVTYEPADYLKQYRVVLRLLHAGADPDIRQVRGRTTLHLLTSPVPVRGRGPKAEVHEAGIRLLLDKGASVIVADDEGETGLQWAAMNCTAGIFRLNLLSCPDRNAALAAVLLAAGADAALPDSTGATPRRLAAKSTLLGHEPQIMAALEQLFAKQGT